MALSINTESIIRLVSNHNNLFPLFLEEIGKNLDKYLAKDISSKQQNISLLRAQYTALGKDFFTIAVDTLSDAAATSLSKRLDKHNLGMKNSVASDHRKHLISLAANEKDLTNPAPPKPSQPAARKTTKKKSIETVEFRSPFAGPALIPRPSTPVDKGPVRPTTRSTRGKK